MLSTVLAAIAIPALAVAWIQWRLQRTTAGGRGLLVGATRTGFQRRVETTEGQRILDGYQVDVGVAGPKVWYHLAVSLEKEGREFEARNDPLEARNQPDVKNSMNCESERITWGFFLTPEDAEKVWVVVSWAEAHGPNLRTDALAVPVRGGSIYKWRWR